MVPCRHGSHHHHFLAEIVITDKDERGIWGKDGSGRYKLSILIFLWL